MSLTPYLKTLLNGEHLDYDTATDVATQLMASELNKVQVAGLLSALKTKGETFEEISGFARSLKNNAIRINSIRDEFYDIVGTGGDGANTFNISTTCAFVLSGAGLNIAKHGNRSISSKCGSADVLATLGVNIESTPKNIEHQLDTIGLSFIYAQLAHPSMKNVIQVRRDLGVPTIFNIVGPLANPVNLAGQLVGVYSPLLVTKMANSLIKLGIKKGAVIHGASGLDEASLSGNNTVAFIKNGQIEFQQINSEEFGLMNAPLELVQGGNREENADILKRILNGETGPTRDIVLLNAGIALYAFDKAPSIAQGIKAAARSIDNGRALKSLHALIRVSNQEV